MKPTAVVTFHSNPYTCGVARFNIALAESLNVPNGIEHDSPILLFKKNGMLGYSPGVWSNIAQQRSTQLRGCLEIANVPVVYGVEASVHHCQLLAVLRKLVCC